MLGNIAPTATRPHERLQRSAHETEYVSIFGPSGGPHRGLRFIGRTKALAKREDYRRPSMAATIDWQVYAYSV